MQGQEWAKDGCKVGGRKAGSVEMAALAIPESTEEPSAGFKEPRSIRVILKSLWNVLRIASQEETLLLLTLASDRTFEHIKEIIAYAPIFVFPVFLSNRLYGQLEKWLHFHSPMPRRVVL